MNFSTHSHVSFVYNIYLVASVVVCVCVLCVIVYISCSYFYRCIVFIIIIIIINFRAGGRAVLSFSLSLLATLGT